MPTEYKFPEIEIERYRAHGFAHFRLHEITPVAREGRCEINLDELVRIEFPRFIRVRQTPIAPEIMVADFRIKTSRRKAHQITLFEEGKTPQALRVEWGGSHPNKNYEFVKVTIIYR